MGDVDFKAAKDVAAKITPVGRVLEIVFTVLWRTLFFVTFFLKAQIF